MRIFRFAVLLIGFTAFLGACVEQKKEADSYQLPDLEDVVIYQINPRVFAPNNSFNAILPQLDKIENLGCNVLWFMPIYPIGEEKSKNSPYAVKDYYDVNPEFGTIEDFKNLINEAHKRGLGVIVDWVPNHTAWDNEWINNIGWYTQDSLGNVIYPEGTDWTDVADLNFDNQDMRLAMIDAMKYWVTEVGVDGFRCDAVDFVPADFLKQCNDSLRAIPNKHLLMLAEGTREDHFESGFDLNYAWDFAEQMRKVYQNNESAESLYKVNEEEYLNIPLGKQKLRFTTNHDEAAKHSPLVEWINKKGSMSAFATILFFPGVPLVYGSQEVGYPEAINFFHHVDVDWTANLELRQEYKTMLEVYNINEGLRKGDISFYNNENALLIERNYNGEQFFIAINVRDREEKITLPEHIAENRYVNLITNRNLSLGEMITLQAFEYLILKK